MTRKTKLFSLIMGSLAFFAIFTTMAVAENYPNRTITVLVPFGAGGAADMHARVLQPALSEKLGTNIVVKNVGGGGGTIGTAQAAASKPDGYTVLYSPVAPVTVQPHLRNIPYGYDSFEPIARVSMSPVVLIASKNLPFKDVNAFIKDAKANPNKYSYASVGAGTIPHIAMVAFTEATGIKMKHLPFRNGGEVMKALLAGQVDVCVELPHLSTRYGLNVLTVFDEKRYPELPDAPTTKEIGVDFIYSMWMGYFAPKGTPLDRVEKFRNAVSHALGNAEVLEKMKKQHVDLAYMEGEEFTNFVKDSYMMNGKILEASGLKK